MIAKDKKGQAYLGWSMMAKTSISIKDARKALSVLNNKLIYEAKDILDVRILYLIEVCKSYGIKYVVFADSEKCSISVAPEIFNVRIEKYSECGEEYSRRVGSVVSVMYNEADKSDRFDVWYRIFPFSEITIRCITDGDCSRKGYWTGVLKEDVVRV